MTRRAIDWASIREMSADLPEPAQLVRLADGRVVTFDDSREAAAAILGCSHRLAAPEEVQRHREREARRQAIIDGLRRQATDRVLDVVPAQGLNS